MNSGELQDHWPLVYSLLPYLPFRLDFDRSTLLRDKLKHQTVTADDSQRSPSIIWPFDASFFILNIWTAQIIQLQKVCIVYYELYIVCKTVMEIFEV